MSEKEEFFLERTYKHVAAVQEYAQVIASYWEQDYPDIARDLLEQVKEHDNSKFYLPEREPYIDIAWSYKDGRTPSQEEKDANTEATEHHVRSNRHHPEYHAEPRESFINSGDRDEIVDATGMLYVDIAEMCCDWLAVSLERGTSAFDWAESNIGVRWEFNDSQIDFIDRCLKAGSAYRWIKF